MQLRVGLDNGRLAWCDAPAPGNLESAVRRVEADIGRPLEDGYVSEVSLGLAGWIADLADAVDEALVLLSDYGVPRREYYAADRSTGWLRCHFRHRVHDDPLILPGIQDITSWVDFSVAAKAAEAAGLHIAGFLTQAHWLLGGGLEEELRSFTELPIPEQVRLSGQVKLLTLPAEMGENFKCLALGKGNIEAPAVFGSYDRAHLL
jgi:SAM-dependent MidA family methyltransferase